MSNIQHALPSDGFRTGDTQTAPSSSTSPDSTPAFLPRVVALLHAGLGFQPLLVVDFHRGGESLCPHSVVARGTRVVATNHLRCFT